MNVLVGTKQFKMMLEEDLVKRLRDLASRAGRDSAQHLAEEILTVYMPVWVSVYESTRRAIDYQTKILVEGSTAKQSTLERAHMNAAPLMGNMTVEALPGDAKKRGTG